MSNIKLRAAICELPVPGFISRNRFLLEAQRSKLEARSSLNRGLSLVEVTVVIGIMGLLLTFMNQIFITNYDLVMKQTGRNENDVGAIFAVRTISETTRGAIAVLSDYTVNGTNYTSGAGILVLKLLSTDAAGTIIPDSYDYLAVYRDGTTPTKIFTDTEPAVGSARLPGKKMVTDRNQTMIFRYNSADITKTDSVSLFLVNSQVVRKTTLKSRAWTSIFLRNFNE